MLITQSAPGELLSSPEAPQIIQNILDQGNKKDLELLLQSSQTLIFNLCQKFYLSPEDSEDACQEIQIKVLTSLGRFDSSKGSLRNWILSIARNHLIDTNRSKGRMEKEITGLGDYFDVLDGLPDSPLSSRTLTPEERLLALEANSSCMLGMLLCLDRDQRIVLILGDVLALSGGDCAQIMSVSPQVFRKRLQRAREDLYSFMHQRCGLVNKDNPCRCHRKSKAFLEAGFLNPQKRVWSDEHYQNIRVFSEEHAEEAFEGLYEEYATMFRNLPSFDAEVPLLDIKTLMEKKEIHQFFHLG